ncbi:hypothetical protein [Neisseria meningitidis]|uniref:hypothetical protein n=2 Tax=Neisseria meningitidis TaxID=487 RepID=UPI000C325A3C|nr:hypothetical protein [Neisseria meningitidis]
MIESIEKSQESIRKNRNPHRVIPAQAGIQKRNATGIYRKKQKPPPRHSRAGGNPETQRGRTLSEKTETLTTVIPAQAGIQKRNATGIYQKKQKPHRPSFPRRRESRNTTRQDFIGKNRNPHHRHSRAGGNPKTQRNRNLSEKTETPPTVIPAQAGIQKHNAAGLYRKKPKPHRPSFPQKRESSNRKTTGIYQQKQKPHRRHSRKSGNPDPSARKLTE